MRDINDDYVHLVRLALEGHTSDVVLLAKRSMRQLSATRPELANNLKELLAEHDFSRSVQRGTTFQPIPVDQDSKLELLRKDTTVFEQDPVWPVSVISQLSAVLEERQHIEDLKKANLSPTRTLLFVGPPGVGKTLAARWLAFQLNKPLFTLDLAAVMSSFLGRTGNNIRAVLNYAQKASAILLLDEFDAVAKKRNDDTEVGELKRLVTVLLQAVDEWPSEGLLIAATNHPELLDPAVWRRFERIIEFPRPTIAEIQRTMEDTLQLHQTSDATQVLEILSILLEGATFSEVVRQLNIAQRESVIKKIPLVDVIKGLAETLAKELEKNKKIDLVQKFAKLGMSQRQIAEITGMARTTVRKYVIE